VSVPSGESLFYFGQVSKKNEFSALFKATWLALFKATIGKLSLRILSILVGTRTSRGDDVADSELCIFRRIVGLDKTRRLYFLGRPSGNVWWCSRRAQHMFLFKSKPVVSFRSTYRLAEHEGYPIHLESWECPNGIQNTMNEVYSSV